MSADPPETPPGKQPDHIKIINKYVDMISTDIEPFSVDERRRIMVQINNRVKIVETVPGIVFGPQQQGR